MTRSDSISSESVHSLPSFIWHYLKDKKLYLLGFVLVALVWAIEMSLSPYLLKVIVDNVVQFSPHKTEIFKTIILPAVFYASMSLIINLTFR
ncbi:TPA: ABC transporter ATP-binding protein, partial [Legionella pneumophila]|nr:ABC transporter ATP-binding protein [Legionella pneumophila]